jgi:hypothetical protein
LHAAGAPEITPAMIEAGEAAFEASVGSYPVSQLVEAVYIAMHTAAHPGKVVKR